MGKIDTFIKETCRYDWRKGNILTRTYQNGKEEIIGTYMIAPVTDSYDTEHEINGVIYVKTKQVRDAKRNIFWEFTWEEKEHYKKRIEKEKIQKLRETIDLQKKEIKELQIKNEKLVKKNKIRNNWLILLSILLVICNVIAIFSL